MLPNRVTICRFLPLALLLVLAASALPGQIVFGGPGQRTYPRGGNRFPTPEPALNFVGMLRSVSAETAGSLVMETDDHRLITILLARRTKYLGASGKSARLADLQPGDRLSIDCTEDTQNSGNNGNDTYHAGKVTQLRVGTAEERSEASQPVDGSRSAPSLPAENDPDRPRLRRAPSAAGDDAPAPVTSVAPRENNVTIRPRRRAVSSADDTPGAEIVPNDASAGSSAPPLSAPPARDRPNDDSDRPRLIRRTESESASARPPSPPESNPVSEASGIPFRPSGDPVIDHARTVAFSFSETLPDYTVKQFTTRYQSYLTRTRSLAWKSLDNVTADLVYQDGRERYQNILLNGRPSREPPEKTGSWSSGEFASLHQDVMSPLTDTDFHGKRLTSIANRSAWRYDFSVTQANSHWHLSSDGASAQPAFTGAIWLDQETGRALRIELSARNLPSSFPLDQVESSVDYDFVTIAGARYLLPSHSEALSCSSGGRNCSRNVTEFRDYRKFTADSTIKFDQPENDPDHK
jgi:hypothetical protein